MRRVGKEREARRGAGGALTNAAVVDQIKGGLIVSCQALPDEPLHGAQFMARMARAAYEGGAVGIRANGGEDIAAIRREVPLPIIGLVKRQYAGSPIFITPTVREVAEVVEAGADLVAIDATARPRPDGESFADLVKRVRERWETLIVADVSSEAEAVEAAAAGADFVATTLVGYTDNLHDLAPYEPPFEEIRAIIQAAKPVPVIAEGRIWEPRDALRCLECGALAVVVGTAITRPQLITARFVEMLKGGGALGFSVR